MTLLLYWPHPYEKHAKTELLCIVDKSQRDNGGETGIRTLGPREGTTVFETAPFDHSGTSPCF